MFSLKNAYKKTFVSVPEPQLVTYSSKEEITAALKEAGINKFDYIDEKEYEGDELQIVQTQRSPFFIRTGFFVRFTVAF
ncbi:hypothetical protein HF638_05725 [Paenibacillus sp. SZ31]|uniref:hypothetical protein n=1 Tax=Paenibacillus sp. SZ31 TaxID=2725555 RepID=UPI00146CF5A3|nr:hypothetical protein [Paenibacillus sp. SZ31]NMI03465.1 hypothetical protein [Paenibacillus sp. SZ31]